MPRHAHVLVAKTAKEMAGALFEEMMRDNALYKQWKAQCPELTPKKLQQRFILQAQPLLLEQARATLAKMLTGPYPEALKDQIADALIQDRILRPDGQPGGFRIG